jgi:hypothetical protein
MEMQVMAGWAGLCEHPSADQLRQLQQKGSVVYVEGRGHAVISCWIDRLQGCCGKSRL